MAEKRPFSHEADSDDIGSTTGSPEIPASANTHDDALEYLRESGQDVSAEIPSDVSLDRELRRKNDYRMIPLLAACYFITFLDKTNLSYAQIMGLSKDIHLHGNQYSQISSIFYVGTLFGELVFGKPSGVLYDMICKC